MENTLRAIIGQVARLKPEFGVYKNHTPNPFTNGINIFTTTDYILGVSYSLITDFKNGVIDNNSLLSRIKIIKQPKN